MPTWTYITSCRNLRNHGLVVAPDDCNEVYFHESHLYRRITGIHSTSPDFLALIGNNIDSVIRIIACWSIFTLLVIRFFGPDVVGSQFHWQRWLLQPQSKKFIGRQSCAFIQIRFNRRVPVLNRNIQQRRFLISLRWLANILIFFHFPFPLFSILRFKLCYRLGPCF